MSNISLNIILWLEDIGDLAGLEVTPEHPVVPENSHFAEVPTNEGSMSKRHGRNGEGSPGAITEVMGSDPPSKVRTHEPTLTEIRR